VHRQIYSITEQTGQSSILGCPAPFACEPAAKGTIRNNFFTRDALTVKVVPPNCTLSIGNYQTTISVAGLLVGAYHYTLVVNGERVDGKKVVVKN
jgi:hypothetical protein